MSNKPLENRIIRFDWAMKRILRDKANFDILNGFLSVVLNQQVEIIELLESESNMDYSDDKFNRVDLKAKNEKGEIFIVEVQNTREADYFHRILYGTSKTIAENIRLGQDYGEVKKVYSISIVYFNLGQGDDYLYHGTTVFRGLHDEDDILQLSENQRRLYGVDTPKDIFPEYYILRVENFNSVATTPLEEWISFLKDSVIPDSFTAPGLSNARERLQLDSLSREERLAYERRVDFEVSERSTYKTYLEEGITKGIAIGEAKGIAQGRAEGEQKLKEEKARGEQKLKEEKFAIANNLLAMGMTMEQISQATGLGVEEISQLHPNCNHNKVDNHE